jgi:hypothetical protein
MTSEQNKLTRPIIGIENRTALEVFDIMCDRISRAPAPSPAPVEGWVMVPIEPTREMWAAMGTAVTGYFNKHHDIVAGEVYSAMLASAPALQPQGDK